MARKKIIAGNWKMNMTPSEAVELVNTLKPLVANEEVDVVFCVPAIDIVPVVEAVKGSNIQVGAENMYFEEKGAYTGEISPNMLVDAGVKYVILGHSERREYFGETNEDINKKMLKAFEHSLTPIMCCGETLEQREQGVTMDFIRQQVKVGFQGITVALIASSNPIGCIFAGLFYGAMKYGGSKLNLVGAPKEVLDIIMGAIVLIIAITHVFKAFAQKKMQKGGK